MSVRRCSPGLPTANWRLSLFENVGVGLDRLAILLSGLALLAGHSSPYFPMSLLTFFLFIATPKSLGIIIDIVLDPLGLPL
jgi:hypothetical protein